MYNIKIDSKSVIDNECIYYLLTKILYQGGDLFDAIAADIKYSEDVARDMLKDLADALQVKINIFFLKKK